MSLKLAAFGSAPFDPTPAYMPLTVVLPFLSFSVLRLETIFITVIG